MARTNSANIAEIIEVDDTISLTAFITTANELVTELCTNSGYSSERLELIERWLAAHFYSMRDERIKTEKAGSISVTYSGKVDLHFNYTQYGQQAMMLDTAGNLAKLNKRIAEGKSKAATILYIGTEPESSRSNFG